jgi:hypothetical protein
MGFCPESALLGKKSRTWSWQSCPSGIRIRERFANGISQPLEFFPVERTKKVKCRQQHSTALNSSWPGLAMKSPAKHTTAQSQSTMHKSHLISPSLTTYTTSAKPASAIEETYPAKQRVQLAVHFLLLFECVQ